VRETLRLPSYAPSQPAATGKRQRSSPRINNHPEFGR
jgi:hypothetical protein